MKTVMWVLGGIVGVVLLIVLAFGLELGGLEWKKFFAPKHAAVHREVFKESRSFNEGKLQDLVKYRLEYLRASDDDKAALKSTIMMMFADFDENSLESSELRSFLKDIKYQ